MNLSPHSRLYGVHPLIVRQAADRLADLSRFTFEDLLAAFGATEAEGQMILSGMLRDGTVSAATDGSTFLPEQRLRQLAIAKIGEPLTRAQAEHLLRCVIKKAEEINSDEVGYGCRVDCIAVFGSYLTDKQLLGDLDLGVTVSRVRSSKPDPREMAFGWWRDRRRSAEAKVYSALRLRRPDDVSIHDLAEVRSLGTAYRVVFGNETKCPE